MKSIAESNSGWYRRNFMSHRCDRPESVPRPHRASVQLQVLRSSRRAVEPLPAPPTRGSAAAADPPRDRPKSARRARAFQRPTTRESTPCKRPRCVSRVFSELAAARFSVPLNTSPSTAPILARKAALIIPGLAVDRRTTHRRSGRHGLQLEARRAWTASSTCVLASASDTLGAGSGRCSLS